MPFVSISTTSTPPALARRRVTRRRLGAAILVLVVAATLALTRPWAEGVPAPVALAAPYCGALSRDLVRTALGDGPVLPWYGQEDQVMDLPDAGRCDIRTLASSSTLRVELELSEPLGWASSGDVLGVARTEITPGAPEASVLVTRTGDRSAEGRLRRPGGTSLIATLHNGVASDPVAALTDVLVVADAALDGTTTVPAPRTPVVAGVPRIVGDEPVCGVWNRQALAAGGVAITSSDETVPRGAPLESVTVQRPGWRSCYLYPQGEAPRWYGFTTLTTGTLDPATAARMPEVVAEAVADGATPVAGGRGWAIDRGGLVRVRVVVDGVLVSFDAGLDTTPDDPAFHQMVDQTVDQAVTAARAGDDDR